MSFSNQTLAGRIKGKPHIALVDGLWRVSPSPTRVPAWIRRRWDAAHAHVQVKNQAIMLRRTVTIAHRSGKSRLVQAIRERGLEPFTGLERRRAQTTQAWFDELAHLPQVHGYDLGPEKGKQ